VKKRQKSKPVEEKKSSHPFYDDIVIEEAEKADAHFTPDGILDVLEMGGSDEWAAVDEYLDAVTGETVRRNVARVDADKWLVASKVMATEAKQIAEKAVSRKELFRIDALVDAFDRQMKERKIGIQPCRLHCQNALRDAYARLS
jgi:hypothetical protein